MSADLVQMLDREVELSPVVVDGLGEDARTSRSSSRGLRTCGPAFASWLERLAEFECNLGLSSLQLEMIKHASQERQDFRSTCQDPSPVRLFEPAGFTRGGVETLSEVPADECVKPLKGPRIFLGDDDLRGEVSLTSWGDGNCALSIDESGNVAGLQLGEFHASSFAAATTERADRASGCDSLDCADGKGAEAAEMTARSVVRVYHRVQ